MSYPGGKNGSGVYQTLINLMPPHQQYIEPFLGMGGVMRHKKPAARSIGIDADIFVIGEWANDAIPGLIVEAGDGIRFLRKYEQRCHSQTLIYCDPPYMQETLKSASRYRQRFSKEQHFQLLTLLRRFKCMVILSGYASGLYDSLLRDWRRFEFTAPTRGGSLATEVVWMNFPAPRELHDYRFLGQTFREREVIRRRIQRWKNRFSRMNQLESFAMFAALDEVRSRAQSSKVAMPPAESPEVARAAATAGSGDTCRRESPELSMLATAAALSKNPSSETRARIAENVDESSNKNSGE